MVDTLYQLAPYVTAGFQHNKLYFGFGSIQQAVADPDVYVPLLAAASTWKNWRSPAAVVDETYRAHPTISRAAIAKAVEFLLSGRYLVAKADADRLDPRFLRPFLYYNLNNASPVEVQRRLAASHVVVLGCGGIGNFISVALATAGVGRLTLVDADIVETSNLTRQYLFSLEDVGTKKVTALARELQRRNPQCLIDTLDLEIKSPEDLRKLPEANLTVLSADTPGSLVWWMNDHAIAKNTPFINVGYVIDVAVWGPFVVPGKTGCWSCQSLVADERALDPTTETLLRAINKGSAAASVGPINMLASSAALLDIIRFLGNFGTVESFNTRIGLWTHELRLEKQDCRINKDCPVCGHLQHPKTEAT